VSVCNLLTIKSESVKKKTKMQKLTGQGARLRNPVVRGFLLVTTNSTGAGIELGPRYHLGGDEVTIQLPAGTFA
jgi:hypothetical protein